MSKAKLKKRIARVLIALLALYLLCLCICAVSVCRMRTLRYHSTAFGVVLIEYELDFEHGTAVLNRYDFDGTRTGQTESAFSAAQQTKLRFVCSVSLMPLWRGRYNNPHVMDGDEWNTVIDYGSREKVTYGSNAYPIAYRWVYDTIRSMLVTD